MTPPILMNTTVGRANIAKPGLYHIVVPTAIGFHDAGFDVEFTKNADMVLLKI